MTYFQGALLTLDELDAVELDRAGVVETLDLDNGLLDLGLVPGKMGQGWFPREGKGAGYSLGSSDNVLEVLQQAVVVLVRTLGLHLRDGLDLALRERVSSDPRG